MSRQAVPVSEPVNADAPYRAPEQAILDAFRTEARDIVKVSSYFAQLRGGTVRGVRRYADPYDRHAQAAMILAFLEQHLDPLERALIRARYTVPSSPFLERRKLMDMMLLYEGFVRMRKGGPRIPKRYAEDVIREWVGYRRHHSDEWWAKHLRHRRGTRTLRNWRRGNPQRGTVGLLSLLDAAHLNAIAKLVEPMFSAGLTQR